jgi:periplasmic divalent cation tolerance protein
MRTNEHALVMVTVGDTVEAREIARALVSSRLAAGVQMIPIESVYEWKDEIIEDHETLLIAKTRSDQMPAIQETVLAHHSYDVPPVVTIPLIEGLDSYLNWIDGIVARD